MNLSLMDGKCPIWDTPSAISGVVGRFDLLVDSPRVGGQYYVGQIVIDELRTLSDRDKVKLTSWLVEQRSFGKSIPQITSVSIFEAQQRKERRINRRVDEILRYLESKLQRLGIGVRICLFPAVTGKELTEDHLIFFDLLRHSESVDSDELYNLLFHLVERRYIEQSGLKNNICGECFLTVAGYERLEEIEKPYQDSTKVFVAMWFDDSMDEVWEKGIRPAITEAGYEPVRIDQKKHANKSTTRSLLKSGARDSWWRILHTERLMIMTFPLKNVVREGGVYYEAGFAHGLGIDVIFTCRKDQINDVHFDTRQYPHILWSRSKELKDALKDRISALYGDG